MIIIIEDKLIEEDDPDWKENHPLGPVHTQIRCLICNKILVKNLRGFERRQYNKEFCEANGITNHIKRHDSPRIERTN